MLLSCPNCATSYEVDRTSLGPTGRSVRCLRCRHVWFASNAMAFAEIANAHRADVTAFTATTSVSAIATPPQEPQEPPAPYYTNLPSASDAVEETPDSGLADAPQGLETVPAVADAAAGPDPAAPPEADHQVPSDESEIATAIDAPALVPSDDGGTAAPAPDREAERTVGGDIETVAARRTARVAMRRRTRSLRGLTTAILALTAIITGLVAWRADVVRLMPQTASLYAALRMPVNLRGLDFANVKTETETQDGVPVLVVAGEIVSRSRHAVEVPRLRFAVRNEGGKEIYAWTALPTRTVLGPGATLPFRTRLASPPREGHQVLVRFFNRRDLVAGLP